MAHNWEKHFIKFVSMTISRSPTISIKKFIYSKRDEKIGEINPHCRCHAVGFLVIYSIFAQKSIKSKNVGLKIEFINRIDLTLLPHSCSVAGTISQHHKHLNVAREFSGVSAALV
jgi:hypothetical protein